LVLPHDLAAIIDPAGAGGFRARERRIERGEAAVRRPQEAVDARGIQIVSHDLTGVVDPKAIGI
jgi:hypothetical protein